MFSKDRLVADILSELHATTKKGGGYTNISNLEQ